MLRIIHVAVTVMMLALLSGCAGGGAPWRAPWNPDTWSYRQADDKPIVLEAASPVAIDVESFNGDVIIEANELLTEATVTIVREATHGYRRKKEAEASLAEIDYSIELVPGELGQVLKVRTWTTHAEPHFQRAHVRIDLPAADGVTVRTQRGHVHAINIEGTVDITTSAGNVRVMTVLPMRRAVTIVNREGDIDYRVRGESTGTLNCQTVRGKVDYRVTHGRLIVRTGTDHDTLLATLNDGENPIELRTVDGNIRVAVVPDPTDVGWLIVDP